MLYVCDDFFKEKTKRILSMGNYVKLKICILATLFSLIIKLLHGFNANNHMCKKQIKAEIQHFF